MNLEWKRWRKRIAIGVIVANMLSLALTPFAKPYVGLPVAVAPLHVKIAYTIPPISVGILLAIVVLRIVEIQEVENVPEP